MYPNRQVDLARKEELILAKQCRQATSKMLRQNLPTLIEASPEFNQKKLMVPPPGTNNKPDSDTSWHQEKGKKPVVHKPPSIPNRAPNFSIAPIIEQRWLKREQAKKRQVNANFINGDFDDDGIQEWCSEKQGQGEEMEEHSWLGDDDCTSMPSLETVRCSSRTSLGSAQFYNVPENKGSWYQLFQSQPQQKHKKERSGDRKEERYKEDHSEDEEEEERRYSKSESKQKMNRRNSKKIPSDKVISKIKSTEKKEKSQKQPEEPPDPNSWNCKKCTLLNPLAETACMACGGSRLNSIGELVEEPNNQIYLRTYINTKQEPVTEEELENLKREKNLLPDGRWICEVCTLQNEALSHYCDACNAKNTFIAPVDPVNVHKEEGHQQQQAMQAGELVHKAVRYFGILCLLSIFLYAAVSVVLAVVNAFVSFAGIFSMTGSRVSHQEPIVESIPVIQSRAAKTPDNHRYIKHQVVSAEPRFPSIPEKHVETKDTAEYFVPPEHDYSEEEHTEGVVTIPNPIYFIFSLLYSAVNTIVNPGESDAFDDVATVVILGESDAFDDGATFMRREFLGLNPFLLVIFVPVFILLLYMNQPKNGDAKIAALIGQLERIVIQQKRKAEKEKEKEKENCGNYNPQPIPRLVE